MSDRSAERADTVVYVSEHGHPMAAIVTGVHVSSRRPQSVDLVAFSSTGFEFVQDVPFSEEFREGHWTWKVSDRRGSRA